VGLCLGPYGGPGGGAVSYERGTPVGERVASASAGSRAAVELQALVAPTPPQGVLVRGHAGLVINKLSASSDLGTIKTVKAGFWPWLSGKTLSSLLSRSLFARKL